MARLIKMPTPLEEHNTCTANVENFQTGAVLGAGLAGASWAALFAMNGLKTKVYDPEVVAGEQLYQSVKDAYKTMCQLDQFQEHLRSLKDVLSLISFTTSLQEAIHGSDIIQENVPEKVELKLDLLSAIDEQMKDTALVLSSTSAIPPSFLQTAFSKHPSNFLIGHSFNPPYLIPLVEVIGGPKTSTESVERAMAFYRHLGKKPMHVRKEALGHVANRLQSALFREIMYMLKNDMASVEDIDTAIEYGPGLRWSTMGASLLLHLGGGRGGAREYADKYMKSLMACHAAEEPVIDDDLVDKWVGQTLAIAGGESQEDLIRRRDELLIRLINAKHSYGR